MSHRTIRHRLAGAAIIAAISALAIGAGAGVADAKPDDGCAQLKRAYKDELRFLNNAHARNDFQDVQSWRSIAFDTYNEMYGKGCV